MQLRPALFFCFNPTWGGCIPQNATGAGCTGWGCNLRRRSRCAQLRQLPKQRDGWLQRAMNQFQSGKKCGRGTWVRLRAVDKNARGYLYTCTSSGRYTRFSLPPSPTAASAAARGLAEELRDLLLLAGSAAGAACSEGLRFLCCCCCRPLWLGDAVRAAAVKNGCCSASCAVSRSCKRRRGMGECMCVLVCMYSNCVHIAEHR